MQATACIATGTSTARARRIKSITKIATGELTECGTTGRASAWCCTTQAMSQVNAMGPTAVIPGAQFWEMPLGLDDMERLSDAHRADDHSLRDPAIAESVARIDPSLKDRPLTVPGGSCVLMSYDTFHRACRRRSPHAAWRGMLKFQFYGTALPSMPGGVGAARPPVRVARPLGVDTSAHDSSFARALIVAALLDDLRRDSTVSLPTGLRTMAEATAALRAGESEAHRMHAAYELGWLSRGGDRGAAAALCAALRDHEQHGLHTGRDRGDESLIGFDGLQPIQRAAMHGLAASGANAVQPLLSLVRELRWGMADETCPAFVWAVGNAAVFSVGEAAAWHRAPAAALNDATRALLELLPRAAAAAANDQGPLTPGDRASGGRPRPGQCIGRLLHAVSDVQPAVPSPPCLHIRISYSSVKGANASS